MATTKKTTKKKKDNGPRSRKYGCVTYNSEPQDNPDCHKGRCSPPARMTSQDGTTKVTQIRYRRRNLDVVSKNCACSLKSASKTKKSAGSKTKKATPKKTVAKAPAKVKAPVKTPVKAKTVKTPTKADAEKIITRLTKNAGFKNVSFRWEQSRKISDLGWVRGTGKEAGDFKWLLSTKLAGLTPMAIQDIADKVLKRIKSGKNEQFRPATVMDLRKHGLKLPNYDQNGHLIGDVGSIREKTVKETVKIPGTKNTAIKKAILDKSTQDGMNAKELSKHLVVASVPKQTAKKEPAKAPAKTPAKMTKDDNAVTIRMSAPLSVQKRALATQRAKVQKKQQAMQQTVDVYDPDSPRPPTPEFIPVLDENKKWVMRRQPKTDKMSPWTFAHVYEKQADDKVRYPQGSVHVVKYKDKFYVAEGNSIISLKKDTKDQAFEQAYRLAKERHLDVIAFFKVKGSNPPKFRMQKLQQ